jgi:riboflavin biosynthesis pyrimidine reductase
VLHRLPLDVSPDDQAMSMPLGEIAARVAAEERPAPADRPWVATNMVVSLDGATAVGGVSGRLGSDVDSAVFHALRGVADVVLAGSGTVTAERYRPPSPDDSTRAARLGRAQQAVPLLAVVSNRGDLDLDLPMFAEGERRPVLLVAAGQVSDDRGRRLDEVAEVIATGDERVDLAAALRSMRGRFGAEVVVCEGGPTLNGVLIADDLIDEWCLTLAPWLVAGESSRAAVGAPVDHLRRLDLVRAWRHDAELLLRYVRPTTPVASAP